MPEAALVATTEQVAGSAAVSALAVTVQPAPVAA